MKILFKIFKYGFFVFILFVILGLLTIYAGHKFIWPIPYSETTTIPDIKGDGICLGVNCQDAPKTAEEFIPVFANQIKNYNQNAPSLWPDNSVIGLYAAVESIERDRSWLISPNGEIKDLTKKELKELCPVRPRYNIGFQRFENDSIRGVYLALSEEALKNVLEYQDYQYLGTYDLLLTYSHEMFHQLEQDNKWIMPEVIDNRGRNPRLDHPDARTERHLIYQLLLKANSAETAEERDSLALQIISNYQQYKKTHEADFRAAKYFDRIEGTAHYYDMITGFYSAYPKQINSPESLKMAVKLLAQSNNAQHYDTPGVDNESYVIGAWAGFLLDDIQEDNNQWKNEIINNPELTPLDILAQNFEDTPLPEPLPPSADLQEQIKTSIQEVQNKKTAPQIFRFLYQLIF